MYLRGLVVLSRDTQVELLSIEEVEVLILKVEQKYQFCGQNMI